MKVIPTVAFLMAAVLSLAALGGLIATYSARYNRSVHSRAAP
jgi:hypothetical protein